MLLDGRDRIRTCEGVRQQIYSLPPLSTWVLALMNLIWYPTRLQDSGQACLVCAASLDAAVAQLVER